MKRSKKIFVGAMALFFASLAYISYDISSRTTFPGSKSQLKERLKKKYMPGDSVKSDSLSSIHR
jgi:hypothetical protein